MNTHRLTILLLLAAAGPLCFSEHVLGQANNPQDPELVELYTNIDLFFRNLTDSEFTSDIAFRKLLTGSQLALDKNADKVKRLAERIKQFDEQYGKYVAHERIAVKRIGRDLVLMKYLYKAEHYPVVWHFTFYRPRPNEKSNWVVIAVKFDTNIQLLGL